MGYDNRKVFLRKPLIHIREKAKIRNFRFLSLLLLTFYFSLLSEGFISFFTLTATFDDTLKKTYDIREVKPKSTIDTPGIKPA